MAMKRLPSSSPISWMVQMLGWLSAEAARGFAAKSFECLWHLRQIVRKKFQRNEAVQFRVFGFVNDAHSAAAELLQNAIVRDGPAERG